MRGIIHNIKGCDDLENTSIRLKKIMQERGLKQVDILRLAEPYCKEYNIKLSKSDLSQYVSGVVLPGQFKLFILGLALNVSEGWLMGLEVPLERNPDEPKTEKPDEDVPAELDPIDLELADLILSLSPAQKQEALHFLQYLAAKNKFPQLFFLLQVKLVNSFCNNNSLVHPDTLLFSIATLISYLYYRTLVRLCQ